MFRVWPLLVFFIVSVVPHTYGLSSKRIAELRSSTRNLFYHGYDNYIDHAFPEDELKPLTCQPLTRNNQPSDIGINDVLGNYSLTLIDSLSSLAILASAPKCEEDAGREALRDFQQGVEALVEQYGDGTSGSAGIGKRARGFDLDSKVQVFETVIRGVGGLLSAHQFAVGDLPISGYDPKSNATHVWHMGDGNVHHFWPNKFVYNGQLLRLALNLAERLLPAFYSNTGLPYPRVNLRTGVPFYEHSPMHQRFDDSVYFEQHFHERTETCSAGAGSLVLEFTLLSRLTGDTRFEDVSKIAFWAVWKQKMATDLIGNGIDAQTGLWQEEFTLIGAGVDSFFEYAFKSYILLSATPAAEHYSDQHPSLYMRDYQPVDHRWLDPASLHSPLTFEQHSPTSFLNVWEVAHAAINTYIKSTVPHTHYKVVHLQSTSIAYPWIDSLSAYYPGLLALAGETEEAVAAHLLYAALWTRYAALPERWSSHSKEIDNGLGWWPGRPEFIESNYHIYRATQDPWYLHVGEMALLDIQRRCWTECGWTGLENAKTGERKDRMESFFLGETAKYLYLLFDPDHPLNQLDAAYVFTTEGHPLIIPAETYTVPAQLIKDTATVNNATCPLAPPASLFAPSHVTVRQDYFHAAEMVGLNRYQNLDRSDIEDEHVDRVESSILGNSETSNHTFYPWTLPASLLPQNGFCAVLPYDSSFRIRFPVIEVGSAANPRDQGLGPIYVPQGLIVRSTSGLELNLVEGSVNPTFPDHLWQSFPKTCRVSHVNNNLIRPDKTVFIFRNLLDSVGEEAFRIVRNPRHIDLILQHEILVNNNNSNVNANANVDVGKTSATDADVRDPASDVLQEKHETTTTPTKGLFGAEELARAFKNKGFLDLASSISSLKNAVTSRLPISIISPTPAVQSKQDFRYAYSAFVTAAATGIGAAPIPEFEEAPPMGDFAMDVDTPLSWTTVFPLEAHNLCNQKLNMSVVRNFNVLVVRRGGCSFSQKLQNIPSFANSAKSLKYVIIVSSPEDDDETSEDSESEPDQGVPAKMPGHLTQPLLDVEQLTPSGLLRWNRIPVALVNGGDEMWNRLKSAKSIGMRRKYWAESHGMLITNLIIV